VLTILAFLTFNVINEKSEDFFEPRYQCFLTSLLSSAIRSVDLGLRFIHLIVKELCKTLAFLTLTFNRATGMPEVPRTLLRYMYLNL
jgi:hypothetical protein